MTDKGYIFQDAKIVDRVMPLKNGLTLEANQGKGVAVTECCESPLYQATVYTQGTTITDAEGNLLGDVQLYEFCNTAGDLAWAIGLNWPAGEVRTYQFVCGLGKWHGISGAFQTTGKLCERADSKEMVTWTADWQVDSGAKRNAVIEADAAVYPNHDTGYSFHGAHVAKDTILLNTDVMLTPNVQAGVLLSENNNSPRHNATCYDRGTTIKTVEGNAVGDAMLLEDTDGDGDVVWLYHEWWYGEGPGTYRFLGGTGKWAGIEGVGKTLGQIQSRADDHYMPTWEIRWKV